jgi:hypothetical protein
MAAALVVSPDADAWIPKTKQSDPISDRIDHNTKS